MTRSSTAALALALVTLVGCSTAESAGSDPAAGSSTPPSETSTRPATPTNEHTTPQEPRPSLTPPVSYEPGWPDWTVETGAGYMVNKCVPESLHDRVRTLTASDGTHLSALELGDGPDGVVLAHETGYNICSFIPMGIELASLGFHVMIPEFRSHGASELVEVPENEPVSRGMDRDMAAAVAELRRLGAERMFMAGASCGGTVAAGAGADAQQLVGLMILSSPVECDSVDAASAVERIRAPSLFVASTGDMQGAVEAEVRELYSASASPDKELVIRDGENHGTDMMRESSDGADLESSLVQFIEDAYSAADG
ncbi:pimeloyl-ACP methyl ester carboxylesterase [Haloactinopolyspora alba]|uniref:Pimeloyl-ACP methyl ester carboxylesterase n=1 Tax=Haloactinopolyspora alba TaxID=648780 RepID=A0A2P8E9P5_9ACTN|nr:alpha/beta hydrolase [Haloactinopolyspora alba]PSL06174.1 pimeloyl-ACP methyl ester carboxylesterase [Haloactinopolyspora alba]